MLMNTHEARLDALRGELKSRGLDGFVIPISDEHMSEYVGAYAQRLAWLTGFGGSAGSAVVLTDPALSPAAAMFVDGRYTLQVRDQVDGRFYAYESVPQTSPARWLGQYAPKGARIGYDAWLHGSKWVEAAQAALAAVGGTLVAVDGNPIDAVWEDQPAPSPAPALVHDDGLAGESSKAKRAAVSEWLTARGLDATVISALDSIAWLLNLRGTDVERTPVALSYVLAHADGTADLYIADEKVTPQLRQHLGNAVRIQPRGAFISGLGTLAGKRVAVDPDNAVAAVFETLRAAGATIVEERDPTILPKAVKNPVERQGHRQAQAIDGVAVTRFLHWLSVEGPKGEVTEMSASDRLHAFRRECGDLRDLSFDTISGAGPNAASPHYRVSEESSLTLLPESVYLVDSGGQYPYGTTDITRTVWIGTGEPLAEVKDRFTRVLKGTIAIDRAVFPKGTNGGQLDALARQFLWQVGLDYAHGTGHGVGSFLSVHEGPQRIGKPAGGQAGTSQELLAGMILSDEPGYYKAGEYGIRIENLILVEPRRFAGSDGEYFGFETLTLVPIDRRMVDTSLLSADETAWWNAYHARVLDVIGPQLDGEVKVWLEEQCLPL
ncbi:MULTISPECIES: aminopeptidase P family protein [Novosphingobium]|uniref:aminopeptidase P family protein n=1 Tax=Novosphingobium sp. ST904 TaxID=1684385 RepID=UPI0006C8508F|nr:aminopeptidase P family protein [Novosphingobium sp. ST904]KPH57603.1 X-Pro aminopeptidase [Novosphingobium sp. ST904]TCM43207.1 Xaa-Pro aminopeptidase [Novosphingobium sp. ST904]